MTVVHACEQQEKEKTTRLNTQDLETISTIVSQQMSHGNTREQGIQISSLAPIFEFLQLRKSFVFGFAALLFMRGQISSAIRFCIDSVGRAEFDIWRADITKILSSLERIQEQLVVIQDNKAGTLENILTTQTGITEIGSHLKIVDDNVERTNKDIREIREFFDKLTKKMDDDEQSFSKYLKAQEKTETLINDHILHVKKQNEKIDGVRNEYTTIIDHLTNLAPQIVAINNELTQMRVQMQALQNGIAPVNGENN